MSDHFRPPMLVVVLGTATEVGKTWVSARLISALRASGKRVAVRKPVQSFDPLSGELTDAQVLSAASGEDVNMVCAEFRSLPVAMAPPMAADVLGVDALSVSEIVSEISWQDRLDIGFVETIGGVRSPIASDGDSGDLAHLLTPDAMILVADADLGVINAVRTSMDVLAPATPVVHLNRFDPNDDLHRRNRDWLALRDGYEVTVTTDTLVQEFVKRVNVIHKKGTP